MGLLSELSLAGHLAWLMSDFLVAHASLIQDGSAKRTLEGWSSPSFGLSRILMASVPYRNLLLWDGSGK